MKNISAARVILVCKTHPDKCHMPQQNYLHSFQWEVAENIFMKMIRADWQLEDFEKLDSIFPSLREQGLSYSEATNFMWSVGKSVIAERGPTDSMLDWIYHTFFVDSPLPLRDWGMLAQSLHRDRIGVLPAKWIARTSRILSDENDSGIFEFPKEWIFAWASEQTDVLEYCQGTFVRPALKNWPAQEGQKLLGLLESGCADTFSFHCALLAGVSDVSFDIPLSKICETFWPEEHDKWLTLATLGADRLTWARMLVATDRATSPVALPGELSFD